MKGSNLTRVRILYFVKDKETGENLGDHFGDIVLHDINDKWANKLYALREKFNYECDQYSYEFGGMRNEDI